MTYERLITSVALCGMIIESVADDPLDGAFTLHVCGIERLRTSV